LSDISGNDLAGLLTREKLNKYPLLDDWIATLRNRNLEHHFKHFANYFFKGTFKHIHALTNFSEAIEYFIIGEHQESLEYLELVTNLKTPPFYQYRGMIRIKFNDYRNVIKDFEKCSLLLKDSEYSFIFSKIKDLLSFSIDKDLEKKDKSIDSDMPCNDSWIESEDNWYADEDDLYDQHPYVFGGLNPQVIRDLACEVKAEAFGIELEDLESKLWDRFNLVYRPYAMRNVLNEMNRIGWDLEQGKDYLKTKFNKVSRYSLEKDELVQFLLYLRFQQSKKIVQCNSDDVPFDDIPF
jgi:hypothetical protein